MAKRARLLLSTSILALPLVFLSPEAHAAPPADEAAAEVLFNQATVAANAGRLDEACPKFAEAQRLDPTAGTLLNLGKCEEQRHNLATAYGAYVAAQALARQDKDTKGREARARDAASRLEPRLSMLVIEVPSANRAEGIEIKRNGKLVGEGQWGARVPMDPGPITIEASAPGRAPWTTTLRIESKPGETRVSVPPLAAVSAPPSASTPKPALAPPPESAWSGQKKAAIAVGGAGLIGVVLGSVFGVQAISKNGSSKEHCLPDAPNLCDATGVDLRQQTKTAMTISTIAFAVGATALAGGVVLFLTAPSKGEAGEAKTTTTARLEASPAVMGSGGGVVLQGSF